MFGDVTFSQAPFASLGGRTLASSVSESVAAAAVVDGLAELGGVINETAFVAGSDFTSNNVWLAHIIEAANAAATQTNYANMFGVQTESTTGADTTSAYFNGFASLAENAQGSDEELGGGEFYAAVAEIVAAADEYVGGRGFYKTVEESATASDSVSISVVFAGTVAELARASSTFSVIKTLNVPVTGVQLLVSIGDTLVWAVIDDSQNPNWQNIDDTQSPGWTNIPS